MPFKLMDGTQWRRTFSRAAIIGWPNAWKTTSALTWPRPLHILNFPGEHGPSSIDPEKPENAGVKIHVWEDDPAVRLTPRGLVTQIERLSTEILSGKHGPIQTFFGDGFHKFYQVIYEACLDDLIEAFPSADKDRLGGRAYGMAHAEAFRYFRKIQSSNVPYVVVTMWAQREKDNPEDRSATASTHIWPDLPGELAKKVMGEFGIVLYAMPGTEIAPAVMKGQSVVKPARFSAGTWQLRPGGKVWGAGIKLPLNIAQQLPTIVPQDWSHLEKLVTEAEHAIRES